MRVTPLTATLLVAAVFAAGRVLLVGLTDPSEARYAAISREMVESGRWGVPTYYGVVHLEKPPLAYWAGAAGITLLGRNEAGVRLFPVLALFGSAVLAAGMARRLAGERAAPVAAAAVALAPYPVAVGEALLTEPFLLFAAALFFHGIVRRLVDDAPRGLDQSALALAIGLLAKGHVVFLSTLLPLLFARTGVLQELARPRRVVLVLGLAAPWFVLTELEYPGFLRQHALGIAGFVGDGPRYHTAPPYIYLVTLLGGLFPFSLFLWRGARGLPAPWKGLLGTWVLIPFLVLTLGRSRSWTYILPVVPALAVVAARGVVAAPRRGPARGFVLLGAGATALAVAVLVKGVPALVLPSGIALVAGGAWLLIARPGPVVATIGLALVFSSGLVGAARADPGMFRIRKELARRIQTLSPGSPVVVAGVSVPSLGFYLDRKISVAARVDRVAEEAEAWGESDRYRPDEDLGELLRTDRTSILVVRERDRAEFVPEREPAIRSGKLAVLAPESGKGG